jgi:hypothetical protein
MTESNRRSFLRVAIESAVKEAQRIAASSVGAEPPSAPAPPAEPQRPPLPERRGTIHELLRRLPEVGLQSRAADIRRLARASVRFEPAPREEGPGASWVAPERADDEDGCIAALDLGELAGEGLVLPADAGGALLVHADETVATGPAPEPPAGARGIRMAGELVLPRVWSAPVQALGLSVVEHDAWMELRRWWAEEQGSELEDEGISPGPLHRVGGYPDERSGLMPMMCELRARNIDAPIADIPAAASEAGIEPAQLDWRLLVQLSADSAIRWTWGPRQARLYTWARAGELDAGRFEAVQVIAR